MNINPALTGIFKGDQRFSASVRDQWRSVPVPWFTTSLSYDQRIMPKASKRYFFGVGGLFNYDRQGDSQLNLMALNLSGSFNYIINKRNIVTLGGILGYSTRGYNTSTLSFDKQWDGLSYDPGIDPGEVLSIDRFSFIETSLGLNYRYQIDSRTKVDIGVSAFHLNKPAYTYTGREADKLPMRLTGHIIATSKLTEDLDVQIDALYQKQNPYTEMLFGGMLNIYINKQRGKKTNLFIGAGYRTSGSAYPKLALAYNEFLVAFSYDIDVSDFNEFTSNRGGPEFHFNYIITHVETFKNKKICPIF